MTVDSHSYQQRRGELKTYFDRTALDAWKKFASDEPLGRIRETVRNGRAQMRNAILARFPEDLSGWRILDAGCGAGAMSLALAERGADVVAIDLSPEIVRHAASAMPALKGGGHIRFLSGDMLADDLGSFDAVVAMDSLIHYRLSDTVNALSRLCRRTRDRITFTFAPRTPPLALMHMTGRLFPRSERAPAIQPVTRAALADRIGRDLILGGWRIADGERVSCGFYTSELMELRAR